MAYLTYFDLVESLIVSSYGGPQDAEQRDIRTAIHKAYSEVTTIRDWSYYHVQGRIVTRPPETSVIDIVDEADSWSLAAGLTSTDYSHVRVGNRVFRITACSSSLVTVENPVPDNAVSHGDAITFFKTVYPLPADFRNLDEPSDEFNWWSGLYVTPDQAMKLERVSNSSGKPYHWTIIKDPSRNGWAIKLIGYPATSETIDFTYRRTARPIRYSGHEAGSRQGTLARSALNVTGTGTAFVSAMIGSILRIGDTTNVPGAIESLTPWVSDSEISNFSSTTSLAITNYSGPIASTAAGTKYLITDPIDVAPHMQQAVNSCCDYWLARIRGQKPDNAFTMYQRDLRLAFEQDQLAPLSGRSQEIWHNGGWRSPLKVDRG